MKFTKFRDHTFLKQNPIRLITSNIMFNMVIMATRYHILQLYACGDELVLKNMVKK